MKRRNFLKLICASPLGLIKLDEEPARATISKPHELTNANLEDLPGNEKIYFLDHPCFYQDRLPKGHPMFYAHDLNLVYYDEVDKSDPDKIKRSYYRIVGRTNSRLKIQKIY